MPKAPKKRAQKSRGQVANKELARLFTQLRSELKSTAVPFSPGSILQLMNQIHDVSGNEKLKLLEKDRILIFHIKALINDAVTVMNDLWDVWKHLLLSLITVEWILMEMKGASLPLPELPDPWPPRPGSKGKG
jgi:hypothetical protein